MNQKQPVNALLVADYLLLKGQEEGTNISNKKLQKLLYYVQAWSLALRNEPVFNDKIEAWIHGPAIKEVYLAFQQFGAKPIEKEVTKEALNQISKEAKQIIDEVWSVYSGYDANYLEHLTHSEKPWQYARAGLEAHMSSDNEISLASMQTFYKELADSKK